MQCNATLLKGYAYATLRKPNLSFDSRFSVLEPDTCTGLQPTLPTYFINLLSKKNLPFRNGPDRWLKVRLSELEPVDNFDMAEWALPFLN